MQKWLINCIVLMLGLAWNATAQDEAHIRQYIGQYSSLAIAEQMRSGVPAAITLAQGIHETVAGTSELATQANNHFGIKCKKEWTGETFAHTDDAPNECFRKYGKAEDSYLDHSNYLKGSPRYASLFKLRMTDYAGWAKGLKQCGYATNPRYAQVLIGLIEDYNLQEYTFAALNPKPGSNYARKSEIIPEHDAPVMPAKTIESAPAIVADNTAAVVPPPPTTAPPVASPTAIDGVSVHKNIVVTETSEENNDVTALPPYGQVVKVNGLKAVYAKKGNMPLEYAIKNNMRYERLLELNEIEEKPLPADMFLYLERKNFRGIRATHTVKEGESTMQISQAEGMQQKYIRLLNKLQPGEEPVAGTVLELQKPAYQKPQVVTSSATTVEVPAAPIIEEDNKTIAAPPPVIAQERTVPVDTAANATITPLSADGFNKITANATDAATTNVSVVPVPQIEEPVAPSPKQNNLVPVDSSIVVAPPAEKLVPQPDTTTVSAPILIKENTAVLLQPDTTTQHTIAESAPASAPPVVEPVNALAPEVANTTTSSEPKKNTTTGPPVSPNDIPAKPVEEPKVVEKQKIVEPMPAAPQPEVEKPEEPKSELDLLKSKFDKVVYAKPKPVEPPPAVKEQPKVEEPAPKQKEVVVASANAHAKYYMVKKGDTAFSIAKTHKITMRQLMDWNNLDFPEVKLGQKLVIQSQ